MASLLWILLSILSFCYFYLRHNDKRLSTTPNRAIALSSKRWTTHDVQMSYKALRESPITVSEHLPPKTGRRYIVIGGVSQIVRHYLFQH